jgi:Spy/CpxP family protein refolding chaperone
VLGLVAGLGMARWIPGVHERPLRPMEGRGPHGLPPFLHELDLTDKQEQDARAIFEKHRPELDAILRESFPRVRAVNDRIDAEIRALLTPEQQKKFDELRARRPRHGPGRPGEGPGPGEPPPPGPGVR